MTPPPELPPTPAPPPGTSPPSSSATGPSSPPSGAGKSRAGIWTAVVIGVICVIAGIWLVSAKLPRWLGGTSGQAVAPGAATAEGDSRKIHATLFYVSSDGSELVPLSQEVPYGATPAEQARRIAEAQLQPAPSGQTSAIPVGTTVRQFYLTAKGEAFLDVSHDIITGHSGGSLDESLTVYAIVNALTVNLPDITAVQILVDGKQVDTLVGHVDLRHPLARSLKWVKKGQ